MNQSFLNAVIRFVKLSAASFYANPGSLPPDKAEDLGRFYAAVERVERQRTGFTPEEEVAFGHLLERLFSPAPVLSASLPPVAVESESTGEGRGVLAAPALAYETSEGYAQSFAEAYDAK